MVWAAWLLLTAMFPLAAPAFAYDAPGTSCGGDAEAFYLTVGGRTLQATAFPGGAFSIFSLPTNGSEVVIHSKYDVRWVQVRPLSAHIQATIAPNHHDVRLLVSQTVPLTIEFNDVLNSVVHLFPYSGDGQPTPSRDAPGMHYFGPGIQNAGVLELKSGDVVYLAQGAWVKGAIRARDVQGITITGHGVLDGSDLRQHDAAYGGVGPIYLDGVQRARIDGILIYNSHGWTVTLTRSSDVQVQGLRILNPGAWNADDGIDVVSSSHVKIRDVFVRTNDDCIAIKNLAGVQMADIQVEQAVLWEMPLGGNGLEIGFETGKGNISDVHFADIDEIHVERGAALSIHNGDSGTVSAVTYDNIRVEDVRHKLIDLAVLYGAYGTDRPTAPNLASQQADHGGAWDGILCYPPDQKAALSANRGTIENIRISNLAVVDGPLPYSVVAGYDEQHLVRGVHVQGLTHLGMPLNSVAAAKLVSDYAPNLSIQ